MSEALSISTSHIVQGEMVMFRILAITFFVGLSVAAGRSVAAVVVVDDSGTFNAADFAFRDQFWGTNSTTFSRQPSGGNVGPWLLVDQTTGSATSPAGALNNFVVISTTAIDPVVFGQLETVAFQVDRRTVFSQFGGSTNMRFVLEQDGRVFGSQFFPSTPQSGWHTFSPGTLPLSSFTELVDLWGPGFLPIPFPDLYGGPAITAYNSLSPIRFGFLSDVGTGVPGGQRIQMGFDNFKVTVTTVPEPTTALALGGLFAVPLFARRAR